MPALTALQAAGAAATCDEVRTESDDVYWLESRPRDNGRISLMRLGNNNVPTEVTPSSANVGSVLHGYGGSAYAVDESRIWYIDSSDGHIRLISGSEVRVIVRRRNDREHYGDLTASSGRLWCVRETISGDELVEIRTDGTSQVLARTTGFFGSPRPTVGGLAWLRWNADQMPWDGSELVVAHYKGRELGAPTPVAGSPLESVTQPCWGADGRLWFVSDRTGWWNLYVWDGQRSDPVSPMATDVAPAEWEAGYASYAPLPGGGVVMIAYDGPRHQLVVQDGSGLRPLGSSYTSYKPYLAVRRQQVLAVAASPRQPPQVVTIDPGPRAHTRVLSRPAPTSTTTPLSQPQLVEVHTVSDTMVNVLLYPPTGAAAEWRAPLVVRAHPGPTASINTRLDWHVQFLTSNGFAVADVDYRGSAGYGRAFRRSLYGHWGTAEVQDCTAVAQHLLDTGRIHPGRAFITGASAGGYTALHAVSGPSVFAGAVARSAIIDPTRWRHTVPRWQRAHAAALLGPAGAVDPRAVNRPVLLIHGADDHIAPIADVAALAAGLAEQGRWHQLMILGRTGHRLSAQEEAAQALEAEVDFYRRVIAG
ncbi:S9 family peptidase [Rugosimonospora acidiphila]|uniref:S9 family peptidase n=1 Tax=Rugosimonospora acidiphila TaxID=556531 RepID=A0ABP9ST50_9ACTN